MKEAILRPSSKTTNHIYKKRAEAWKMDTITSTLLKKASPGELSDIKIPERQLVADPISFSWWIKKTFRASNEANNTNNNKPRSCVIVIIYNQEGLQQGAVHWLYLKSGKPD